MIALLSSLTPDTAILLLTLGLALIAVELNRPGAIFPGALGLLATLLACARLAHDHPRLFAIGLLCAAAATLLLQSRRSLPFWIPCLGTAAGIAGFARIVPGIHPASAILCGLFLGAGTTVLTRIAHRARQNKGLD